MPIPEQERLDAIAKSIAQLWRRQDEFAQRLARIEAAILPQQAAPMVAEEPPLPAPSLSSEQEVLPVTAPLQSEAAKAEKPRLETKVGLTIINRVGVVTLVLGVAFFFKWAVDNNWIGPGGRVVLGVLAGFAALGAADFLWRKGQQVFAQGVTGTGIAVLYLAFYAAFGFYHLIPQGFAFLLMFAATGMAMILSLRYDSQAITILGLFGGYLTPLLLSSGEDRPWFLFSYVLLLNVAAIGLARMRNWRTLEALSLMATVLIYGGWLVNRFARQERRVVATVALLAYYALYSQASLRFLFLSTQFLAATALSLVWVNNASAFFLFALFIAVGGLVYAEWRNSPPALSVTFASFWLSYGLWNFWNYEEIGPLSQFVGITLAFLLFFGWLAWRLALRIQALSVQRLSVLALNGVIFYAAAYALLNRHYHGYLGLLAVAVAGVYLGFGAYLYRRRAAANLDLRPVLLSLGMSLCFITLAIPIQFTGFTITIAWSIQAAALTWIGLRFQSQRTVAGALFVVALVFIRLMLIDSFMFMDARAYQLLFNRRFITFVVAAISSFAAAYWASAISRPIALIEYFGGHVILLWGLTMEVIGWAERSTPPQNLLSVETVSVSILFGIYAVILVSVGVSTRTAINRIAGLGLIGIVIVKLYLFDVWQLGRIYRISAFVVLGLLLMGTSFLYSRFRRLIESYGRMMKLVLSLLVVSCSLRADFDVQRWQFRRPVEMKEAAAVAVINVDDSMYRDSRARLRDLRVIRAGSETPYQLRTMSGSQEEVELRPTLLNKAVAPHVGLQAVLDLNGHRQHNRLRLATWQRNFKETVRIETSDDGRDWALVLNDGLIFDISREDRDVSDLTVEYPVSTRRYLRLTIPGWDNPAYLQSAWLLYRKEIDSVRDVMAALAPVVSETLKAGTSSVLFDLRFEGLPYDRLDVSIGPGMFSRDVEVFVSNDRNTWSFAGGGVVLRTAERTQLSIQVPEQWSRYVKLSIFNGDDPPLPVRGLTLQGFRRTVQFPAIAPGPYWLYLGNAAAKEPSYDFARLTPAVSNANVVLLGRPENNQQYRAPTVPWTDRYPYLLYAVLIGAVAVMGYIVWRFLTKLKTA